MQSSPVVFLLSFFSRLPRKFKILKKKNKNYTEANSEMEEAITFVFHGSFWAHGAHMNLRIVLTVAGKPDPSSLLCLSYHLFGPPIGMWVTWLLFRKAQTQWGQGLIIHVYEEAGEITPGKKSEVEISSHSPCVEVKWGNERTLSPSTRKHPRSSEVRDWYQRRSKQKDASNSSGHGWGWGLNHPLKNGGWSLGNVKNRIQLSTCLYR